jgi:hypothetical protein
MRLSALALVIFASAAAGAAQLDAPPTLPEIKRSVKEMCVLEANRELSDYFRKEFQAEAFVDMQPISSATRSDEVPSAFYFWVRASTEDAKQYRAGTARVVLRVNSKCNVTGFISKADILASRARLADFFRADLIPKILWFAETPTKRVTNMRWQP